MRTILTIFWALMILFSQTCFGEKKWINWSGNEECIVQEIKEPKSIQEVIDVVKEAASLNHKVKVVGNGYSRSRIACTSGVHISLKQLNKILSIDQEKGWVTAEAGITIDALNDQLVSHNLCLANIPAMGKMTLGGAIATGARGTGHTGTLSSFVKKVSLVAHDGAIHEVSSSDKEIYPAVRLNLGALGVVYTITLECKPLFYLTYQSETISIEELLERYQELHRENAYFQFAYHANTGLVDTMRWNYASRTDKDAAVASKALSWYVADDEKKDLSSEIAIPIEYLSDLLRSLDSSYEEIFVRFGDKENDIFLSPSLEGAVAYVSIFSPVEEKYTSFYRDFQEKCHIYKGKPHFGKILFLNPQKALEIYGKELISFKACKDKLDPKGVFSNDFLDAIFGVR